MALANKVGLSESSREQFVISTIPGTIVLKTADTKIARIDSR